MDGQNILRHGMKRRRDNSSKDQNQRLMRKPVYISDDTWLEALKFLTSPQWSQKRYVSRHINGIAQRSISHLPKMMLDSAAMYYVYCRRSKELRNLLNKYTIVAFDTIMQKEQSKQWLMDHGFTLDAPMDIPPENTLISARNLNREYKSNVNMCIHGSTQVEIPLSDEEKRLPWFRIPPFDMEFRKTVLYYAQFNPIINQYSWDYLMQFIKFVYDPMTYIKDVKMFAVNQKFVDLLKINIDSFDNEPRYICCGSFELNRVLSDEETNTADLSISLIWLVQNVRAETIHFPEIYSKTDYVLLANFLIDPTEGRQCASKEITIRVFDAVAFLNILIQKFHSIPLIECTIPTIVYYYSYKRPEELSAHLGPNVIDQEVDSQGADALYMISNGQNRMRVSFRSENYRNRYCHVSTYSI